MPKNLIELIKASNGAGSAGQSFKTNVTGASSGGVSMVGYLVGSPGSYSGTPQTPVEFTYSTPQSWSIGVVWSGYGGTFYHIRRNGPTPWLFIGTGTVTINSVNWDDGSGTSTLNLTVEGEYDSNTIQTLTSFNAYFSGYSFPNMPAGSGAATVEVTPLVSGSSIPSGTTDGSLQWIYDPDIANYNPQQTTQAFSFRIARRAYPVWSTMYEWRIHSNSSYNSVIGTNGYSFDSYPEYSNYSVGWIEYRLRAEYGGGGAYTPWGELLWTDGRDEQ